MNTKGGKTVRIFIFAAVFLPFFISCSMNGSQKSFLSSLDEIDVLINQHQYKEAVKNLGKIEKKAYSSWAHLGIFRRYRRLGENAKAENILAGALKANPENIELSAVYSNFLLREGRLPDALAAGKCLKGTKYGSVYSEAVLQDIQNRFPSEKLRSMTSSPDYFSVYYDAYTGSGNNAWLRNCAIIYLSEGAYESAGAIRPSEVYGIRDAYFWALVMYDAKRFGDAVNYAEAAKNLIASSGKAGNVHGVLLDVMNIEADSYTSLKDEASAERIRQEFISALPYEKSRWILPEEFENENTAVVFVNSARWAFDNNNNSSCSEYLSYAVNVWPDYVPALALYADFAYQSSLPRSENIFQMELRDAGSTTLEMEQFDNRIKIPVSDAEYRIKTVLDRTDNPLLYVILLDLKYKTTAGLNSTEKCADLWNILEKNMTSPDVYPEVLSDYAVNFLIKNRMAEEAWNLFYKFLLRKYEIPAESDFWKTLLKKKYELSQKELEYAAYFAAAALRADDALALYETACLEKNGTADNPIISLSSSDISCINLAMIYNSLGRRAEAVDIYSRISGRCASLKLKSLVMYRLAVIHNAAGDIRNARRSAEYALTLDPDNAAARLFLNKLKLK